MSGLPFLSDAGLLPDLLPQIIEVRPADPARPEDLDLLDAGRVDRERPLHPDPVGDAPDRERLAESPAAAPDHHALERLEPVAPAFGDLDVDPHGIPGPKGRDLGFRLLALNGSQPLHDPTPPRWPIIPRSLGRSQQRRNVTRPGGAGPPGSPWPRRRARPRR